MKLYKIFIRGWEYPEYVEIIAHNDTWFYVRLLIDWVQYDGWALVRSDLVLDIQEENSGMPFPDFLQRHATETDDFEKNIDISTQNAPLEILQGNSRKCVFFTKNDKQAEVGDIIRITGSSIKIKSVTPEAEYGEDLNLRLSNIAMIAWDTDYLLALESYMHHPKTTLIRPKSCEINRLYQFKIRGWREPVAGILKQHGRGWLDIEVLAEDYRFDGKALINIRYLDNIESNERLLFKERVLNTRAASIPIDMLNVTLDAESSLISWLQKYTKPCAFFQKNPDTFKVGGMCKALKHSFYCKCYDISGKPLHKSELIYLNRIRMVQYANNYLNFISIIDAKHNL